MQRILRVTCEQPQFAQALRTEYEVFAEAGFAEVDDQAVKRLLGYRDYDANSVMVVACNDEKIIGVLREIHPDHRAWSSFKSANDFPEILSRLTGLQPESVLEIGTVAIPREYRGTDLALKLYGNVLQSNPQATTWIASLDERVLRLYRERIGFLFETVGTPRFYMGSMTEPAMLAVNRTLDHLHSTRPLIAATLNTRP
jgi:hypothetical protein